MGSIGEKLLDAEAICMRGRKDWFGAVGDLWGGTLNAK